MRRSITTKLANSLSPAAKPIEVWDTSLSGLILRIEPTGLKTYYLQYRRKSDGKRIRIRLGRADALVAHEARELAKAHLADVYKGDDPSDRRKLGLTINYLTYLEETYKPWLCSNLRTGLASFNMLRKSFPELHKLRLDEINPLCIEAWRRRRQQDGVKPTTINRELADLRALLNRAVEWGVLKNHPLPNVKPCKIDSSPKVRYLSDDEERRLRHALDHRESGIRDDRDSANQWRAARGYQQYADLNSSAFADYLKPAVLLSLHTGLRRAELFGLKWSEIDWEQRIVTVLADTAKSGTTRHVPLNEEALSILKSWKQQPGIKSQWVFPGESGRPLHDVRKSWDRVLEKAGILAFRWHDLRHSFASRLVMAGVDLNTVRELLGHSDYKMTLRYAHLAPAHKAAAVAKLCTPHQPNQSQNA